jgi:DNA primase
MMENRENHGFINESLKEQIRGANDIVEVTGSYFSLQKAGSAYKAKCPFHKEKTDSFMVNPGRQSYHCFGCGAGGDVFKFIQQHEGVEFLDAVKILAERAGIKLDFDSNFRKTNPLYDALSEANRLYQKLLKSDKGKQARDYLASRQITMDTADKFQLGFAPESWDFILQSLKKDFNPQILEDAGLVCPARRENTSDNREKRYYDRFRNRLMFPYLNPAGKAIAFTGRTLSEDPSVKYINSPETLLFHKGKVFYGMRQAQRAIYDSDQVIIVESNSSVLTCNQSGLENVIATSGTAFTEEHRDILLKRFPGAEIIFCFDGDTAGKEAGARTSRIVLGRGNTKVCVLPSKVNPDDSKDPDDFIRTRGLDYLKQLLAESKPTLNFLVDYTRKDKNLDLSTPEGLIALLQDLKKPLQESPLESKGILIDILSQTLHLKSESIEQRVFGKLPEVVVERYDGREHVYVNHERKREWENRFVKMILRDGKIPTIKYFCEERKAAELMSEPETRYVLQYLNEQTSNMPLFLSKTQLFRKSTCERIVNEIADRALKDGVPLNKKYLWYLFISPLEDLERKEEDFIQRRFSNGREEDKAKRDIQRTIKPTLEDMEKALTMIKFKKSLFRLNGIHLDLGSSQLESAVEELEKLLNKYQKEE